MNALSFAYFALGVHMLDAAWHYWKEDEPFSFALNLSFGLTAVLIGLALQCKEVIQNGTLLC